LDRAALSKTTFDSIMN